MAVQAGRSSMTIRDDNDDSKAKPPATSLPTGSGGHDTSKASSWWSWWRKWSHRFLSGEQLRHKVAMLAGGTAAAQLLNVASMPVLSRLYTPGDFGVIIVMNSLANLLSIVATLRLQVAIPLPGDARQARDLLKISLGLALVSGAVLFAVIAVLAEPLFTRLQVPQAIQFWWFLPVITAGLACYGSLYHWALRLRQYRTLARTRLVQAVSNVAASTAVGCVREGPLGLLIGAVLLQTAGTTSLLRGAALSSSGEGHRSAGSWKQSIKTAREFFGFAAFGMPAALLNASGLMLPPLLISAFYGSDASGSFGFAFRVVSLPVSLVGVAVAQVFLAEASPLMEREPWKVYELFNRVIRRVAPISALLAGASLACPALFPLIFGPRWAQAGQFAGLLAFFCAGQMIVSPVSNIAVLMRRQGSQLMIDGLRTVGVILSLWLPYRAGASALVATCWFTGAMVVLYVVYYAFYRHLARSLTARPASPT